MKRLKRMRRSHLIHDTAIFCRKNGQLLFFTALILVGAVFGCMVYTFFSVDQKMIVSSIVSYTTIPTDFMSGCVAVVSASFSVCLLLILLFLLGLTAYGCPLIILVPLFFGFWMGSTECYVYENGGISAVAIELLPHILISAAAVLIACAQSLQMSCLFSRQLLPSCAHCGGMWHDFKLYLLRFLFCIMLAFSAAVCKVLLQIF